MEFDLESDSFFETKENSPAKIQTPALLVLKDSANCYIHASLDPTENGD